MYPDGLEDYEKAAEGEKRVFRFISEKGVKKEVTPILSISSLSRRV